MGNSNEKILDIVNKAVDHKWSIPEFQRGFVWKPVQVRDLAESLWLNYPVGTLLVWNSKNGTTQMSRNASDSLAPELWLVDGQQRTTALSIIFGRKPYWWPDSTEWEKTLKRFDIRFDINAKQEPYFLIANAAIRNEKKSKYIPLKDILNWDLSKESDQAKLRELSKNIKSDGLCDGQDAMEVYTRLDRLNKIREKDVLIINIDHDLEDVVEIFSRMNSRGTRVTEADIYLGVVSAKVPGWVRTDFLPFLENLKDAGFDINPNLLFRSLTGVGVHKSKFKEIDEAFWDEQKIKNAWEKTKTSWKKSLHKLRDYGVYTNDILPTETALVTLVALVDKFSTDHFDQMFFWFLQASRYGRYSGASASALDEDLKNIKESETVQSCIVALLSKITIQDLSEEDFLKDYSDSRFGRFILYLIIYQNKALDWDSKSNRLGFDGTEIFEGFRPQWHHIFPKKYLEGNIAQEEFIHSLANIAVIGPEVNIRIGKKSPMDYVEKYKITNEKLSQQYILDDIRTYSTTNYMEWLKKRTTLLANAANSFLDKLKN